MAETTGIGWCDATFNPWVGCDKVSPGCAHCYAETLVTGRMGAPGTWGADGVRRVTADSTWRKPLRWARLAGEGRLPDGSPNEDGHRPRVFCASLADVFEPRPDLDEPRLRLFHLIYETPELDWLLLTKRIEFAREWLTAFYDRSDDAAFVGVTSAAWEPARNVWVGTSIENSRHTWRADVLRETPAALRFISAEPLLGSLYEGLPRDSRLREAPNVIVSGRMPLDLDEIDWLIVGGESGADARPMQVEWVRELRHDAVERGIPFFFKQWGGRTAKAGGKVLDGDEWCHFPASFGDLVPA